MSTPEDPIVVCVPGLGLDAREWQGTRVLLHGPMVVVPLPAQGLPAARGTDLSVEAQAERLLEWLDGRVGDRRVVLVGHSVGCPVAVQAAVRSRSVIGLVLIGPVTDPAARSWPQTAQRWLRTACHERLGEARLLLPQYARTGLGSLLRGHHAMRWYRTEDALGQVDVPVVVVAGELDRIPSARWLSTLVATPGRSLLVVAGAGHMVPLTHPEAVAMAIQHVSVPPRR